MFINAHLRSVLHGFEPFVPQRTELLHQRQRLIDMTNNGVSAWADFRDAASLASTPESCWDHHNDDFGDSDNTPPTNAYHRYHQDISTAPRAQTSDYGKVTSPVGFQGQFQEQRRISTLPTYEEQMVAGLSVFDDKTSPVTGQDYQSWGHTSRHKTLPHSSNGGSSAKNFQYEQPGEPCFASLPTTVALAQPQPSYPYVNATILDESLAANQTSPSTEYSTYSSSRDSSADSLSSVGQDLSYGQSSSASNLLWDQNLQGNTNPYHVAYTLPLDGLPKQYTQQQYLDIWSDNKEEPNEEQNGWIADSAVPKYISPKQVPLERFYATSAAESSQGLQHSLLGTSKLTEDLSEYSDREVLSVVEPEVTRAMIHQQQQRHLLPDYSRSIHRSVPVLRSNDFASTKIAKRRPAEAKAGSNACNDGHRKTAPRPSAHDNCEKAGPNPQKVPLKRIEPKPVGRTDQQTWSESPQSSQATHYREAKDDFLVKSKLAGMSYKDIRRQGKFTEAESTLRGRFRTLTKHKNARVRKPEWDDNDIRLLKRATRKLIQNQGTSKARIPWKQVAEYIANHGGSYHFGNATCRKKWDELQEQAGS